MKAQLPELPVGGARVYLIKFEQLPKGVRFVTGTAARSPNNVVKRFAAKNEIKGSWTIDAHIPIAADLVKSVRKEIAEKFDEFHYGSAKDLYRITAVAFNKTIARLAASNSKQAAFRMEHLVQERDAFSVACMRFEKEVVSLKSEIEKIEEVARENATEVKQAKRRVAELVKERDEWSGECEFFKTKYWRMIGKMESMSQIVSDIDAMIQDIEDEEWDMFAANEWLLKKLSSLNKKLLEIISSHS